MKIISILAIILSGILLMGSSGGLGSVVGLAATTAPGESGQTCARSGCHRSGTYAPNTTVELKDANGDVVDKYMPGFEYSVKVTITASSGTPGAYGFQMVALKDSDDTSTDSWVENFDSGIRAVTLNNRRYVEQFGPRTSSNSFTVNWTAPIQGSGAVTFYAVGNAVNRNGSISGDSADASNITIAEELSSPTRQIAQNDEISLFPNPTIGFVNIASDSHKLANYKIFNIIGKFVGEGKIEENSQRVDLFPYKSGIYLISIYDDEGQKLTTRKLIKK